jgi:hypothetical protein
VGRNSPPALARAKIKRFEQKASPSAEKQEEEDKLQAQQRELAGERALRLVAKIG